MQNRLVLTGIPIAVPHLPNAFDSLKDLVEDHACWVDRFAFLSATTTAAAAEINCSEQDDVVTCDVVVAAVELHIENVRDKAIQSLDGMVIRIDGEGGIITDDDDDDDYEYDDANTTAYHNNLNNERQSRKKSKTCTSFQIHAYPATKKQSAELIQKCPLQSDDVDGEKRMEKQTLHLPLTTSLGGNNDDNSIALSVRKSEEHGGTGTYPWRGGLILSRMICHWAAKTTTTTTTTTTAAVNNQVSPSSFASSNNNQSESNTRVNNNTVKTTIHTGCNDNNFQSLFCNKKVLELGAGSSGLPSMTLGKFSSSMGNGNTNSNSLLGYETNMDLTCSDGIDEIVTALRENVRDNALDHCVRVQHIDWNDYTNLHEKESIASNILSSSTSGSKVDTIIFADCIYNEECAVALCRTICHLLKRPGGTVLGVLPDFRVGLSLFEARMKEDGFVSIDLPIVTTTVEEGERQQQQRQQQQRQQQQQHGNFACNGGNGKDYRLVLWRDNS